ncbi:MAG: AAA family ATPase [Thermodesulfobacteriota bacterium]
MPATKPCLFIFLGLIASGKSTLAQAFAQHRGIAAYNSDVVRKKLAGLQASEKSDATFADGIYTPEFSRLTYDELLRLAAEELNCGRSVVLDASYHKKSERSRLVDLCTELNCTFHFILCQIPEQVTKNRLNLRAQDPEAVSDGTWDIYLRQKEVFEYPDEIEPHHFLEISTDKPVNELLTLLTTSRTFPTFSS